MSVVIHIKFDKLMNWYFVKLLCQILIVFTVDRSSEFWN